MISTDESIDEFLLETSDELMLMVLPLTPETADGIKVITIKSRQGWPEIWCSSNFDDERGRQAEIANLGRVLQADRAAWLKEQEARLKGRKDRATRLKAMLSRAKKDQEELYAAWLKEKEARCMRLKGGLTRAERITLLGLDHLLSVKGQRRPRHRPPSADTLARRDEVAHWVIVHRILNPGWSTKKLEGEVEETWGVKRRYMHKALETLDPERRAKMEAGARAYVPIEPNGAGGVRRGN
jgi:hypothetical protein